MSARNFEVMRDPDDTKGPEEPRVIGNHSLRPVVGISALGTVEDIGVLGMHRSVVPRGIINAPTRDIGETMWSATSG